MASSLDVVSIQSDRKFIWKRLSFGVGSVGTGVFTAIPSVLLLFYLTTTVHVQPAVAGLVIMLPKLISILTDPFVGHFSDRLKTRSELHRRLFMSIGAVSAGLGLWALFTLPAILPNPALVAGAIYLVIVIGFSCFAVPYVALPADIEPTPARRQDLVSTRMSCAFVGGLSALVAAPIIVSTIGYPAMGAAVGLLCFVGIVVCITTYSSRPTGAARAAAPEKISFAGLANKTFLRVLLAFMLLCVAYANVGASMPFIVEGLFKRSGSVLSLALLVKGVSGFLTTVTWPFVLQRIGATVSWRISALLMIIGYGILAVATGPDATFFVGAVVGGVAYAAVQVTGFVSLAHAANKSESAGHSGSGMVTGLWLAGEKVAYAMGPLVVGIVMQLTAAAGESDRTAIIVSAGVLPAILAAVAVFVLGRHGEQMA